MQSITKLILPALLAFTLTFEANADNNVPVKSTRPFYAFQDGMVGMSLADQAKLLKDQGYDGIEYEGALQQLPEMLQLLDAQGIKLQAIYTGANVDPAKPSYDPGLKNAITQLKGRCTVISLHVQGGKASTADQDDRAVAIIREIADMADASGIRVSLYPHTWFYVARVEDAVRLAKKVDRKNVGVSFNLCHFLKQDDEQNLEARLQEALPYLFLVSINGTDGGSTQSLDWNRLIQPLDRGSFDVGRVIKTLDRLGYAGPVGLQCYAIPGDPRENLKRSINAWRALCRNTQDPEDGFRPIFNGKDLTNWEGEPGWWSVEDGAITGTTTAAKPLDHATYIFWRGGKPADFELHATYRFTTPGGNSGINFRSRELPKWDIQGYQADMETGPNYTGILYECNQRGIITQRGQRLAIAPDGQREVSALQPAADWTKIIKQNDWNDYVVIARGPEIVLKINGVVTSHVIDHQQGKSAVEGIISLQAHPGPPMKVQFKNIRIRTYDK